MRGLCLSLIVLLFCETVGKVRPCSLIWSELCDPAHGTPFRVPAVRHRYRQIWHSSWRPMAKMGESREPATPERTSVDFLLQGRRLGREGCRDFAAC